MRLEGVVCRYYRLRPAAFEILGRTDRDNVGVDGLGTSTRTISAGAH